MSDSPQEALKYNPFQTFLLCMCVSWPNQILNFGVAGAGFTPAERQPNEASLPCVMAPFGKGWMRIAIFGLVTLVIMHLCLRESVDLNEGSVGLPEAHQTSRSLANLAANLATGSRHPRSVHIPEHKPSGTSSKESRGVIFTSFFNSVKDPQSNQGGKENHTSCSVYLHNLYLTVEHLGLDMVVFHDGVCRALSSTATTERIHFAELALRKDTTPNDFRFLAILQWWEQHLEFDWGFLVDGFDIILNRDPIAFMRKIQAAKGSTLFVTPDSPPRLAQNGFVRSQVQLCMPEETDRPALPWATSYALNCGTWGGNRSHTLCVLRCMRDRLLRMPLGKARLCDMAFFTVCVATECAGSVHVDADHTLVNPMRDCRDHLGPVILHNKCNKFRSKPCLEISADGVYTMQPGMTGTAAGCSIPTDFST
jgi:hypothetical protein